MVRASNAAVGGHMTNPTPQGGPMWTQQRLRDTFAKVAKADGTVGADEIMLIINGIIGEYEVTIAAQAAQITSLEQQLAQAISAYKEVCEVIAKEQPDATGRGEPMWDKDRIAHEVLRRSKHHSETSADWGFLEVRVMGAYVCEELLHQLRDSYEAKLAQQAAQIERDEAQIAMLQEMVGQQAIDATRDGWRIAELERQLAEAKGDAEYWHGMFVNGGEGQNE